MLDLHLWSWHSPPSLLVDYCSARLRFMPPIPPFVSLFSLIVRTVIVGVNRAFCGKSVGARGGVGSLGVPYYYCVFC